MGTRRTTCLVSILRRSFAFALMTAALGCSGDLVGAPPDAPDHAMFEAEVFPVLLRDCAFPDCHGNHERFLVVYGPGRVRMSIGTDYFDPARPEELALAYERARSMLRADAPEESLLVQKPLEVSAGGAGHKGTDEFGRNVFRDTDADGFRTLLRWAETGARGSR